MSQQIPTIDSIRELHRSLNDLTDAELSTIIVIPAGTRLEPGATYLDLKALATGEFQARAGMLAQDHNWYVAQKDVPLNIWYILLNAGKHEMTETEANAKHA